MHDRDAFTHTSAFSRPKSTCEMFSPKMRRPHTQMNCRLTRPSQERTTASSIQYQSPYRTKVQEISTCGPFLSTTAPPTEKEPEVRVREATNYLRPERINKFGPYASKITDSRLSKKPRAPVKPTALTALGLKRSSMPGLIIPKRPFQRRVSQNYPQELIG